MKGREKAMVPKPVNEEYEELKAKNEEYKEALKVFRGKLNEVAVFNSNLAYVTKLFMEHSTTKNEKLDILKRFDTVESMKDSKSLYKIIDGELSVKTPVTESIEKVTKTPSKGSSNLSEGTVYKSKSMDNQMNRMKELMMKIK